MKIIVMGSGIIGVTTSYFLAREGHDVTVIDAESSVALGCSFANGCQLSYSHIEPWSLSFSLNKTILELLKPQSSVKGGSILTFEFLCWLKKFCRNLPLSKNLTIAQNLFNLSTYSINAFDEIIKIEKELDFHYQQNGILHFFTNEKSFRSNLSIAEFKSKINCPLQILTPEEVIKKEPSLLPLLENKNLKGGIFYKNDATADSKIFTSQLAQICKDRYNVKFAFNQKILNFLNNKQKITGINTSTEVMTADSYVYALGTSGNSLLRGIGIESNIYSIGGYSISIPIEDLENAPKIGITDQQNKVVYSRIGNTLRVAGTIEINNKKQAKHNEKIISSNINFIKDITEKNFVNFGDITKSETWYGERPFRPNSTPLICNSKKYSNLYINTGHGSLGFTLAAGSAKFLTNLISNTPNPEKLLFLKNHQC